LETRQCLIYVLENFKSLAIVWKTMTVSHDSTSSSTYLYRKM